jgi:hypothetical protein
LSAEGTGFFEIDGRVEEGGRRISPAKSTIGKANTMKIKKIEPADAKPLTVKTDVKAGAARPVAVCG